MKSELKSIIFKFKLVKLIFKFNSQVVVFQPPRLQVKLEPTEAVYSGSVTSHGIRTFIQTELFVFNH